ncbi:MAG: hypothetical protein U0871_07145 [Gemmataceae bacterium]
MAKNRFAPPEEWARPVSQLIAFNLLAHNLDRIHTLKLLPVGCLRVYATEDFPCVGRPFPPGRCTTLPTMPDLWEDEPWLVILPDTSRERWAVRVLLEWGEKNLLVEFATIPHTDPVGPALRIVLKEHFGLEYPAEELEPPCAAGTREAAPGEGSDPELPPPAGPTAAAP